MNTFGSLAVAAMLVMGSAFTAHAMSAEDVNDMLSEVNFGQQADIAQDGVYVGGSRVEAGDNTLSSTSLTLTDKNFKGELNAGSVAVGSGVKATVNNAAINISGGSFDGTDIESSDPFPIRGGGIAINGGESNVDNSSITISNTTLNNTTVWAGGVVVDYDGGKAHTGTSIIDITGTQASGVNIYGGSDGGSVGTSTINVKDSSVSYIFAGGDYDTVDKVNITVDGTSQVDRIITNGATQSKIGDVSITVNGGTVGHGSNAIVSNEGGGSTQTLNIALNGGIINGNVIAEAGKATISVSDKASIRGDLVNNSGSTALTVSDAATMTVADGHVQVDNLEAASGSTILVGDDASAGRLTASEVNLNGAKLFLDPAWKDDPSVDILGNASHVVFGGSDVNGQITAGRNSLLVLGDSSSAWAEGAFQDSGLAWGKNGVTAALAVVNPQTLQAGQGSLLVDGSLSTPSFADAGDAIFTGNSLLMVRKEASSGGNVALTGTGSGKLTVDKGAKLYIRDAEVGEYAITSHFGSTVLDGWVGENLVLSRLVKGVTSVDENGNVVVTTEPGDVSLLYPGIVAVNSLNALDADSDSAHMGVRFLSRAMDKTMLADGSVTDTINEVSRAAVTAGVQNTALRLSDAASDNVLHHLSLGNYDSGNTIHQDGTDLWITPMYGNTYTHGMAASGTSVRGNYGGIAFGVDTQVGDLAGGKVRVGAALNGGGGKSETRGTATSTENSYNFGGINLYAGWNLDNINILASLGYGIGDNDIEMNLPSSMRMGRADADVDTGVFTADLRVEYQVKTDLVDVLPHAGVRYTSLHTDRYDLKVNGSTLNSVKSDTQNIVQFPVGVAVTKNIDVAGWNVKPQADVSVIPAVGEKKAFTKVNYSGVNAFDSVNTRIMDSTSWAGMVGVQAEKGNLSLGLNYGVQASSHETDQKVMFSLSWKF